MNSAEVFARAKQVDLWVRQRPDGRWAGIVQITWTTGEEFANETAAHFATEKEATIYVFTELSPMIQALIQLMKDEGAIEGYERTTMALPFLPERKPN